MLLNALKHVLNDEKKISIIYDIEITSYHTRLYGYKKLAWLNPANKFLENKPFDENFITPLKAGWEAIEFPL